MGLSYCEKEENNFVIRKGQKIYKGVKYFYSPDKEIQLFGNLENQYFGDKYIAFHFAKTYVGGIQVYEAIQDIKLFNLTNDKNLLGLIHQLKQMSK